MFKKPPPLPLKKRRSLTETSMRFNLLSFSLPSLLLLITSSWGYVLPDAGADELYLDDCSADTGKLLFCHFMVNSSFDL